MKKQIGNLIMLVSLLAFILAFIGCATFDVQLSQKAISQNINAVTSERMVEGMTMVHAFTNTIRAANSLQSIANRAANKAADDGYSDITVLAKGDPANVYLFEISYWRK